MWHTELVADGRAFCICCVQTGGFVLVSPGEDRAFLLASRFLSVGATKENICGMQRKRERERRGERERGEKKIDGLANTSSLKCFISLPVVHCLQLGGGGHVDTSRSARLNSASMAGGKGGVGGGGGQTGGVCGFLLKILR